jgi:hypothetical protein
MLSTLRCPVGNFFGPVCRVLVPAEILLLWDCDRRTSDVASILDRTYVRVTLHMCSSDVPNGPVSHQSRPDQTRPDFQDPSMTRRYADQISVEIKHTPNGDYPKQFRWRGGLYQISAVLARWIESDKWWQATPISSRPMERHLWRVEANFGRLTNRTGVFDLCVMSPGAFLAASSRSEAPSTDMRSIDTASPDKLVTGYLVRAFD